MQIRTVTEDYIKDLISSGKREDGRSLLEYRPISIKSRVIPNAEGSAEVIIGGTKVIVGVKIAIDTPMPDKPNDGNLVTSAELLPIASESYEMGPPSPDAIELARVTDRGIRASGMVDLASLFIEKDKIWEIFVDIYVLNYDGNLFDASTLAAVTALSSARMPKYENEKIIREGDLGKLKISSQLTSCTFAKLADRIMLDPDKNEEAFMGTRLTITTDGTSVRAMQKGLSGSFTQKELENMLDITFDKSKELNALIEKAISD